VTKNEKNNLIKDSILKIYNKAFSPILKKQKIFIFQTYLSKFEEVVLNLKLKQVPNIFFPKLKVKKKNFIKYDKNLRKKIFDSNLQEKSFENFLLSNLYFFLPTQFLENFKNIKKLSDNLPFPKEPKIIFTSHGLSNYTLSKFYIADKVNSGSKLIHGQHGGVYGIDFFTSHEEYERNISNLYLTWGWKEDSKTIPVGILKPIEKISRFKKNISLKENNLLYVLRSRSRYSVNLLHSDIRSSQMLKYYDENIKLISSLRKEIRNSLLLRLHSKKFGWDEDKRFLEKINDIKIDDGYEKIFKLINNSKLVLFTYNATGYLETLASNVPTILYFNSKDNPIRANSEPYFEQLKKVNIFFDDIFEATKHINSIWSNIDNWWNDKRTQEARINFCENYAKINNDKINLIKKIITEQV
jgi:putative transferase (TIGR04331 family)